MGQTSVACFYNMNQTYPFDPKTQSWHFPPHSDTVQTNLELNISWPMYQADDLSFLPQCPQRAKKNVCSLYKL